MKKLLLSLIFMGQLGAPAAFATPYADQAPNLTTYVINGSTLIGVDNLEYNGLFYDVSFQSGSCDLVFAGCTSSAIAFNNSTAPENASLALIEALFYFNTTAHFSNIAGCNSSATLDCDILTPYVTTGSAGSVGSSVIPLTQLFNYIGEEGATLSLPSLFISNDPISDPDVLVINTTRNNIPSSQILNSSSNSSQISTWADWTLIEASPVPEPTSILLVVAGLLALGLTRRTFPRTQLLQAGVASA